MPKFPGFANRTKHITGSVFEKFRPKFEEQGDNLVKLHIGDSYSPPSYDLPINPDFTRTHPLYNRYCDTFGIAALREALVEKIGLDNGMNVGLDDIMITAGATNGLSVAVQSLVEAGDEVLLLAPYWPFFRGMVCVAGGDPIEVPFYTALYQDPRMDIGEYLERWVTPRTVALYVNTPNNPSGKVLDNDQLDQIAAFGRKHDLWLISDEAYDGMTFDGRPHLSIGTLPEMFERTLTMFTFSKVFMFSGLRLGYVVGDRAALRELNKIMVHQLYSPSTMGQQMMVEPVRTRPQWSGAYAAHIQELRDLFIDNMRISPQIPEGAYYLFFSIKEHLDGRDYWQVIDACIDNGVSVAPGRDFGADYTDYIRLCFAGEPPDRLSKSIERLNRVFPG